MGLFDVTNIVQCTPEKKLSGARPRTTRAPPRTTGAPPGAASRIGGWPFGVTGGPESCGSPALGTTVAGAGGLPRPQVALESVPGPPPWSRRKAFSLRKAPSGPSTQGSSAQRAPSAPTPVTVRWCDLRKFVYEGGAYPGDAGGGDRPRV